MIRVNKTFLKCEILKIQAGTCNIIGQNMAYFMLLWLFFCLFFRFTVELQVCLFVFFFGKLNFVFLS